MNYFKRVDLINCFVEGVVVARLKQWRRSPDLRNFCCDCSGKETGRKLVAYAERSLEEGPGLDQRLRETVANPDALAALP